MAHSTEDRLCISRDGKFYRNVPVAAAEIAPVNTVAAVNAAGAAGKATNAAFNKILGVVEDGADNTAGLAGAKTINVRRDTSRTFVNSGTAAVTAAHIGLVAKWEDNQTVAAPATANLPAGGTILGITSEGVEIYFP